MRWRVGASLEASDLLGQHNDGGVYADSRDFSLGMLVDSWFDWLAVCRWRCGCASTYGVIVRPSFLALELSFLSKVASGRFALIAVARMR